MLPCSFHPFSVQYRSTSATLSGCAIPSHEKGWSACSCCCADHSVYDPASGARVLAGPAPQPLAAILLEYDAATDELAALGTVGAEQFDAFFTKYEFKLALDHGQGKARRSVGASAVVRELDVSVLVGVQANFLAPPRTAGTLARKVIAIKALQRGREKVRRGRC